MRTLRIGILTVLLALSATNAAADDALTEPEAVRVANEVSAEVYSPFCPGKTMAMCTSAQAADTRREIKEMAQSGMSKEEIKQRLIATYGEEFRYVEADSFDDAWTYGLIGVSFLLALAAVAAVSRRKTPAAAAPAERSSATPDDDPEGDDPYLRELRQSYRD